VTLGVWWSGRERFGWGRAVAVAGLLVLGYFGHLVSLALTAFGLVVLAAATPGPDRRRRLVGTAVALGVLVPLGLIYRGLSRAGGAARPTWGHLTSLGSASSWWERVGWVDPLTLGSKTIAPFVEGRSVWCGLLVPTLWFAVGASLFLIRGRG